MKQRTQNPCTVCGQPGIPGLIRGQGKCQYHWNVGVYGREWADHCRNEDLKRERNNAASDGRAP